MEGERTNGIASVALANRFVEACFHNDIPALAHIDNKEEQNKERHQHLIY